MKNLLIVLLIAIILPACGALKPRAVMADSAEVITIDPAYLVECSELKALEVQTFEGVLENTIDNVAVYKECKDKQHNSILLIKRFANIKDK